MFKSIFYQNIILGFHLLYENKNINDHEINIKMFVYGFLGFKTKAYQITTRLLLITSYIKKMKVAFREQTHVFFLNLSSELVSE